MANTQFQMSETLAATPSDFVRAGCDLFKKGVERNAEVHKHMLDTVAQHNADAADVWRDMFRSVPGAERWLNFAEQSFQNFLAMQRQFVEFIGQRSKEAADITKEQGEKTVQFACDTADTGRVDLERSA